MTIDDNRLARMEAKIDQLSTAFVLLARIEEKMIAVEKERITDRLLFQRDLDELHKKIDKVEDNIMNLQMETRENSRINKVITGITWIVLTAIVSLIGTYMSTLFPL